MCKKAGEMTHCEKKKKKRFECQNMTHQNWWDVDKAVLQGKFVALY